MNSILLDILQCDPNDKKKVNETSERSFCYRFVFVPCSGLFIVEHRQMAETKTLQRPVHQPRAKKKGNERRALSNETLHVINSFHRLMLSFLFVNNDFLCGELFMRLKWRAARGNQESMRLCAPFQSAIS